MFFNESGDAKDRYPGQPSHDRCGLAKWKLIRESSHPVAQVQLLLHQTLPLSASASSFGNHNSGGDGRCRCRSFAKPGWLSRKSVTTGVLGSVALMQHESHGAANQLVHTDRVSLARNSKAAGLFRFRAAVLGVESSGAGGSLSFGARAERRAPGPGLSL